jgi:hypothetical protein
MPFLAPQCSRIKKDGQQCKGIAVKGKSVCRMHGGTGGGQIKSGRYSKLQHERLKSLFEEHQADENPLDTLPELAMTRAIFQDFIQRYERHSQALIAWHEDWKENRTDQINPTLIKNILNYLDHYENLRADHTEDFSDQEVQMFERAKGALRNMLEPRSQTKPTQILDIADAYRIVSEVTKMVERIEKTNAASAISRKDFARVLAEMARTVQLTVTDEKQLKEIRDGWNSIALA